MRFAVALLSLALAQCSTSGGAPADAGDETAIGCANDPRADAYAPNLRKKGAAGTFTFVLVSSDPAPPARGSDAWVVRVEDAQGAPVANATVTVKLVMPDHGHGTSVVPAVTPSGDAWKIAPLYLFMPGLWQITIAATANGASDSAAFTFCVAG